MHNTRNEVAVAMNAAAETFRAKFGVSKSAARQWCLSALLAPVVQQAIIQQAQAEALKLLVPTSPNLPDVE
jgi:hypothetical protein